MGHLGHPGSSRSNTNTDTNGGGPMGATSKSIRTLLDQFHANELVLPEIQREFVWKRRHILNLFDSLFRGMPIGSLLVWKAMTRVHQKPRAGQSKIGGSLNSMYGYLLDGQQRLTALLRVRDGDDDYPLLMYLWPDEEEDPEEEKQAFYWPARWTEDDPWCIPVAEVLNDNFKSLEYIERLKKDEYFEPRHAQPVLDMLDRLKRVLDYEVSIIEYESSSYEEAKELFIRFNSTGMRLRKTDLVLADLALRVPGLASKRMRQATTKWQPQYRFTLPFLTQCLAAVHTRRLQWKRPHDIWDGSPKAVSASWDKTEQALGAVIEFLTGTVRWDSASWLPSFNALIPLIAVCARRADLSLSDRELARKWLLLAGVHGYFSGAVYTELDRLLKRLDQKPTVRELWAASRRNLPKLRGQDFETSRMSGAAMAMYVSMLRNADARDWQKHTPLDGTVVGKGAKLNVHHFFPRALLLKHQYLPADINTMGNYVLLSAGTNLNVGTEEPVTYLARHKVDEKELIHQCVPLDKDLWRVGRYKEFLKARRQLLADRCNEFLG
jgi:hypothetical protein